MSAHIHVTGNVGRDPEERFTAKGTQIASFSVAHNWRGQDGNDQTTWYRVSVFGKSAAFVAEKVRKGMGVYVHGEHRFAPYTNSAGVETHSNDIIFAHVTVTDWKDKGGEPDTDTARDDDDQIPF